MNNRNSYQKILQENLGQPSYKYIPKAGEIFWYVNLWAKAVCNMRQGNSVDSYTTFVETFKTKEEAGKHLEFLIVENILRQAHFEISDGWIPSWNSRDETKYFILYNHNINIFNIDCYWKYQHQNNFYFKSRLLAEEFLNKYKKELKIYFRINK